MEVTTLVTGKTNLNKWKLQIDVPNDLPVILEHKEKDKCPSLKGITARKGNQL